MQIQDEISTVAPDSEDNKSDNESMLKEIQAFAKRSNSEMGQQLQRVSNDLEFEGGAQFDDNDNALRGPGRARVVFNLTRNYCNQIINGFRSKPFGIVLNARTDASVDKATLTQGIIRGIESKSDALAAYTTAVDRQVKAGRGYVVVTTDYESEEGLNQEIKIQGVIRPDMVIWDPFSKEVDGKDATQCAFVEHISKQKANDCYDMDLPEYGRVNSILTDTRWSPPEDSVEVLTYFKLKRVKSTQYFNADGEAVDPEQMRKNSSQRKKLKSRPSTKTSVQVVTVVAKEIVSQTEIKLSRLPVIPFLGEMIDANKKTDWVGLVNFARDPAKLVNGMASLTAERINLSPKATQYVDMRSIANYKDIWQQANKLNLPFLPYDSQDPTDPTTKYEAPKPRDVQVQIGDVTQAQQIYQGNLAGILGIPEAGLQQTGASNETAAAVLTRSRSADMSNYQFLDNAAKSIKAVGRVVLELLPLIYDTPRLMPISTPKGTKIQNIDISEMNLIASEFDVDVDAGPMAATQRKEEFNSLVALGTMLGPDIALAFASDIVKNSEFSNAEAIASKIESVASTKLGLNASSQEQDPEAVAALNQAEQTIDQLSEQLNQANLVVQQLQAQVVDQQKYVEAEILKAQISAKSKIDVEAMKQQGKMTEQQVNIQAEANLAAQKAAQDLEAKLALEAAKPVELVEGVTPRYNSVQGQRNDF